MKELRLPTFCSQYQEIADHALRNSLTYEQYLHELALREVETRRNNAVQRYLKESKLPLEKTFESFKEKRLPLKTRRLVSSLKEGEFLERKENVLVFGNPGTGKTHLLCALAHELIAKKRRIYFTTCSGLVQALLCAKHELRLARYLKSLDKFDAVLLDDIGYVQQSQEEMEVLFELLAHRYERGSMMITSNLQFSEWERIFKNPVTTAAAIDRLVHHCVIVELNLKSYRQEEAELKQINS